MERNTKEYFLGLDMGTSSVGWAVTDCEYRLLRTKGKDMWGIREFEEAETAVDRRTKRISRRRRQREVVRIGLLKSYFDDAIHAIDPNFFVRLDNSKYHLEDKDLEDKYGIFADKDYTDKEYYAEFPTIFHLRSELLHNEEPHDVRFVYLALLNMFKHRGHFLNAGLNSDENGKQIGEAYVDFVNTLAEYTDIEFPLDVDTMAIEEYLSCRDYNRTQKAEKIAEELGISAKDKQKFAYIKAICGLKVDVKVLFKNLILEEGIKIEVCFSDFGYEEKQEEIAASLGEDYYSIIECMKAIYDAGILSGIMKGYDFLSDARVASYEKHRKDLRILKDVIRKYKTPAEYNELFREDKDGSYSAYVNSTNSGKKQRRDMKKRTVEDFEKTIKNCLKGISTEDEDVAYILEELDKESFLPKQLTASNGVIPNQVHTKEMKKILNNAEKYLPFLKERDESGKTVSERIVALFTFQIPYYIGPTTENSRKNHGNGWVVRKEEGAVLPWNMEQKIDMKKTSEEFISRMVRRCTYINGEQVLPKASLEYESFCVLNEINNIRICGEKISVSLKQELYRELFQKGKKVTRKQLETFFYKKGLLDDAAQLSGVDQTINSSLSTYGKFKAIFGDQIDEDDCKKMVEKIVFWCTVYGDSKKYLKQQLEENYADVLSEAQIKRILGFKFKDWGNLSKELLELPGCDKTTGENVSLIRMMWNANMNFMELLNNDLYTYKDALKDRQESAVKTLKELKAEDLDEYYFSAPVKRMIWQTILIIREIEKVMGCPPKRLFIEMTRKEDDKKQRTESREKKLLEAYREESAEWKNAIKAANENGTLKSKKMYLYFTQKGRCMYTGKPIDIDNLFNDKLYDIDHIYPRHFVKDDNINNNLVLVDERVNARKSDNYPLEADIYQSQKNMWQELLQQNLITEEKYRRLTGRNPFTDEQKAGFIARQLVETSQGTKGVADILKQVLPETDIVYSKASNVAEFRRRGLPKCRSVNEFHHAHDAYLNIVVGNVYFVKFTQNPLNFIKQKDQTRNQEQYKYNLSKMFDWDVIRGEETAWIAQKEGKGPGTIATVKKMLAKNTPLYTRLSFEGHGGIANETLYSAEKAQGQGYIPLKSSDNKMTNVKKYGGYTSVSTAYYFLVEHEVKKKRIRTLETVPIYLKKRIEKQKDGLEWYCKEILLLKNPVVKVAKIKIQSLVKVNGFFMHISGKTGNQIIMRNAVNLCLKLQWMEYIKVLEKSCEKENVNEETINKEKNMKLFSELVDKHNTAIFKKKPNAMGDKLNKSKDKFEALDLLSQCKVLLQILQLSRIGTTMADLRLIGLSANSGKILISKNIANIEEFKLINQSVTGLFETSIDLLTV